MKWHPSYHQATAASMHHQIDVGRLKKKKKKPKKPAKLLSGSPVSLPGDRQSEKKKATTTESTCGHDLHISVVDERPAPRSLQRIVKEIL